MQISLERNKNKQRTIRSPSSSLEAENRKSSAVLLRKNEEDARSVLEHEVGASLVLERRS